MIRCTLTYDVTTPESAEDGDTADHGFYLPGGWEHSLAGDAREAVIAEAMAGVYDLSLRDGLHSAVDLGAMHEAQHTGLCFSLTSVDPPCDRDYFERGEERRYGFHIKCDRPSEARRVRALLQSSYGVVFR